jgi:hypothetical protein
MMPTTPKLKLMKPTNSRKAIFPRTVYRNPKLMARSLVTLYITHKLQDLDKHKLSPKTLNTYIKPHFKTADDEGEEHDVETEKEHSYRRGLGQLKTAR